MPTPPGDPSQSINSLLAPRFLFQVSVPIRRFDPIWSPKGVVLDESYRLPDLAALDQQTDSSERRFADVRMAWAAHGIAMNVIVKEKSKALWCHDSRLDESDGLQVWVDTRATHNLHRATKFCARYAFAPRGAGKGNVNPVADQLLITRARENARPVRPRELQVLSKVTDKGYAMACFMPAVALTGYDPSQYRSLGFNYSVIDRELGIQTFSSGPGMPYDEDPSCWATLELVDN